jgi:hypothetical protein
MRRVTCEWPAPAVRSTWPSVVGHTLVSAAPGPDQPRLAVEKLCRSMPDFEITPGATVGRSIGMIKNFDSLPVTVYSLGPLSRDPTERSEARHLFRGIAGCFISCGKRAVSRNADRLSAFCHLR